MAKKTLDMCFTSNDGITYCWNDQKRKWVKLTVEELEVDTSSVPNDVVDALAHQYALKTRFE